MIRPTSKDEGNYVHLLHLPETNDTRALLRLAIHVDVIFDNMNADFAQRAVAAVQMLLAELAPHREHPEGRRHADPKWVGPLPPKG